MLILGIAGIFCASSSIAQSSNQLKDEADAEFHRLEVKYTGNSTMLSFISRLHSKWAAYRDERCYFEKAATAGGKVLKDPPPEAYKAHRLCLMQTTSDIKAALAKY
jgi:DNA-binding GntR family transcriptional regulator